ncbi:MAG: anti-sigma factor, partial [Candidatus Acidiferrales bacterium]
AKLAEARGRVSLLALAAKPMAPPAAVKSRLMEQLRAESSPAHERVESRRQERPRGLFGRWTFAWAAAAAVLALATGLLWYQDLQLKNKMQQALKEAAEAQVKIQNAQKIIEVLQAPDSTMITLASSDVPQASGKVCYNARLGRLACSTHLTAPPPDKSYQLWLVPMTGDPVSASVFGANMAWTDDMWMADVKAGTSAKAFAVTLEPAGGMPLPTGPKVLIGVMPQRVSFSHPARAVQAYYVHAAAWRSADRTSPNGPVRVGESFNDMR